MLFRFKEKLKTTTATMEKIRYYYAHVIHGVNISIIITDQFQIDTKHVHILNMGESNYSFDLVVSR